MALPLRLALLALSLGAGGCYFGAGMLGMDWGWKLLHCWFVTDQCRDHVLRAKN